MTTWPGQCSWDGTAAEVGSAVLAVWTTRQLWFDGVVNGMVLGLLALGVVLVYRSTRVINLAVGNMGLPATGLMALLVINYGFPYWVALPIALVVGIAVGALIERAVIRRLFDAPRVIEIGRASCRERV